VEVTYLLHLWVVFVLTMVRSRPHYLRHQWSQISTFVSLNHIHHHTYFKSSYVSHFTPLYNEIVISIWVLSTREAYCRNWQRKLIRCMPYNLAAKTVLLLAPQFQQQVTNSLRTIQLWHRITNSLQNTKFSSKCKFAATTQFRQQITNSLHNTQFDSEC